MQRQTMSLNHSNTSNMFEITQTLANDKELSESAEEFSQAEKMIQYSIYSKNPGESLLVSIGQKDSMKPNALPEEKMDQQTSVLLEETKMNEKEEILLVEDFDLSDLIENEQEDSVEKL